MSSDPWPLVRQVIDGSLTPREEEVQDEIDQIPDDVGVVFVKPRAFILDAQLKNSRHIQEQVEAAKRKAREQELRALVTEVVKRLFIEERKQLRSELMQMVEEKLSARTDVSSGRPWYRRLFGLWRRYDDR